MDEAGLLNSMTREQLVVTCNRLQRSCKDMEKLLDEFQQEQSLLRREQDRLHRRVEQVTAVAEAEGQKEDHGIIWSVVSEVDKRLEVSQLFRAKEERRAAKRRRWIRGRGDTTLSDVGVHGTRSAESQPLRDQGPFSDDCINQSWGNDVALGNLRPNEWKTLEAELNNWVRNSVCGDPVAEAEIPSESAHAWTSQFGVPGTKGGLAKAPWSSPRAYGMQPNSGPPATARRSNSRPEPPGISPKSWMASSEDLSDLGGALREGAGQLALGKMVRAPVTAVANFADAAADWASNLLPADPSPSRTREESPRDYVQVTFTVVMRRSSADRRWGLQWEKRGFNDRRVRIVDNLQSQSVAEAWNNRQEQEGHPERRIHRGDRLVSANGKTQVDDIKGELAGREVVLAFARTVPRCLAEPMVARDQPGVLGERAPGFETKQPIHQRRSFQGAFQDFMKTVAPESIAAAPGCSFEQFPNPDKDRGESSAESESPQVIDADADFHNLERAAAALAAVARGDTDPDFDGDQGMAAVQPSTPSSGKDPPYALVVQVLSRNAGKIQLSWLFNWVSVPREFASQADLEKRYLVVHCADEVGNKTSLDPCARSDLSLELPPGHRYTLWVSAALVKTSGADHDPGTVVWSSTPSIAVNADLRPIQQVAAPTAPPAQSVETVSPWKIPAGGFPRATSSSAGPKIACGEYTADELAPAPAPPPARRRGVADSLGNFIATRTSSSFFSNFTPPISPAGTFGGSNSDFESPLKSGTFGSPLRPGSEGPVVIMGPAPLPRVPERRDVAEMLRLRRKGNSKDDKQDWLQQSSTFDSDDEEGNLLRVANALDTLERAAAASGNHRAVASIVSDDPDAPVASESPHSMQVRMDEVAATSATSSEALSSNPAAAAAAFARGCVPSESPRESGDYSLEVQVADDKTLELCFSADDDLGIRVRRFLALQKLKEVFEQPLIMRAQSMLDVGTFKEVVDICELLD